MKRNESHFHFLETIRHFHFAPGVPLPFKFADDLSIREGPELLLQLISRKAGFAMGGLEITHLEQNPYVYWTGEFRDAGADAAGSARFQLLTGLLSVQFYCLVLWLIRDHACHGETAYLIYPTSGDIEVTSNFWGQTTSCADGRASVTSFNTGDLRKARTYFNQYAQIWLSTLDTMRMAASRTVASKGVSRIMRAFFFLQGARASADPGVKIANVVTALEVLFSTSKDELTYKLSERISFLLDTPPIRSTTFRMVKDAYKIRSSVVHGGEVDKPVAQRVTEISVGIDEVLRRVLRRILDDETLAALVERKGEDFDSYFERLIFDQVGILK